MATTSKKPKKATKAKKPKPLTAADYLLYNEMISSIRALEVMATERFMSGNVDRAQLANNLRIHVGRIQTRFRLAYGKCRYPYCGTGGVCELCFMQMFRKQLTSLLSRV